MRVYTLGYAHMHMYISICIYGGYCEYVAHITYSHGPLAPPYVPHIIVTCDTPPMCLKSSRCLCILQ